MDIMEKLVELLNNSFAEQYEKRGLLTAPHTAMDLIAQGVTVQDGEDNNVPTKWISASEPPKKYRDEYGELIPFLVCLDGTEYPFRAMYDGKVWGDGWGKIPVTYWMPLPEPPKGE